MKGFSEASAKALQTMLFKLRARLERNHITAGNVACPACG